MIEAIVVLVFCGAAALWWSEYTRPENVLARLEKAQSVTAEGTIAERVEAVRAALDDHFAQLHWRIRGMVPRLMPAGPEQDDLYVLVESYYGKPLRSETLDELWNEVFWDLQYGSVASDTTKEFADLEDDVLGLQSDVRTLEKLERAFGIAIVRRPRAA